MRENVKKVHFIGICGSAMGSVASMLKEAGLDVQGSDNELYPPMSDYLKGAGIRTFDRFSDDNITDDVDLVVVGNAISRGNAELEHVLNNNIRYTSFPEVIREFFIRGNKSIVVAGTHGKTSTSSLISWILEKSGREVGFLIGGIPLNFNKGFLRPPEKGGYFVVEGDEYDTAFFDKRSKFLHYLPDILILNNLEFDHADIFTDLDDIKRSFSHLIRVIPENGLIAANADDDNIADITKNVYSRLVTFGINNESADYHATNIKYGAGKTEFDIVRGGKAVCGITTYLTGEYSVYNILAAFSALHTAGLDVAEIISAVLSFRNVKRRLEVAGEVCGVTIYDDFAHHPTAIKKTIDGVKKANPEKRVLALFEPKSNTSRRNIFQNDFPEAFSGADTVIIGKVYNFENMDESERLDPFKLIENIKENGTDAYYIPDPDELAAFVSDMATNGDIILAMSSGSFYGIHKKILDKLGEKS
jgi:UDP-N-acetylmuramate: L-alanyl-gamma-D-glutamyl-meso-diaminopimelate ligase